MALYSNGTSMKKAECEKLIKSYIDWLKEGISIQELEKSCQITTPFLDRHNDALQLYVEKQNGNLRITDDGYTIKDLRSSGLEITTEKRSQHLKAILNGFGVQQEGDEIFVLAGARDFPQKKHNLVQAMLEINDIFIMATEHVLSLFKEDVASFLEQNQIPILRDFKLSGKTGFDHRFDFGLPKTSNKPERILQAINNLNKDQATNLAFAVTDVRGNRLEPMSAYAFLHDTEHPPQEENLAALRAYDIIPLLWSRRTDVISTLNGG